jgi:hypothetical protein
MEIILYIFAFAWLSNLLTWRLDMPIWIKLKNKYLNYKVFKCATCNAFWITIPINILLFSNPYLWITLPFVISYTASIMEKQLNLFN